MLKIITFPLNAIQINFVFSEFIKILKKTEKEVHFQTEEIWLMCHNNKSNLILFFLFIVSSLLIKVPINFFSNAYFSNQIFKYLLLLMTCEWNMSFVLLFNNKNFKSCTIMLNWKSFKKLLFEIMIRKNHPKCFFFIRKIIFF